MLRSVVGTNLLQSRKRCREAKQSRVFSFPVRILDLQTGRAFETAILPAELSKDLKQGGKKIRCISKLAPYSRHSEGEV